MLTDLCGRIMAFAMPPQDELGLLFEVFHQRTVLCSSFHEFGAITATVQNGVASPERLIQFALKLVF